MSRANDDSHQLRNKLRKYLETNFNGLRRGQEYLDYILELTPFRGRWRLAVELLIEGSDDDKGGRGISAKWKSCIKRHASDMLDALLEVIKQFCASHHDKLAAGTKVSLKYHNFGVRRRRVRTICI